MLQAESVSGQKILEGEKLFEEGKIDEAEVLFSNLLQDCPLSPIINNNMGAIKYLQGYITSAKEFFLSALSADKDNIDAFTNLKDLYRNHGLLQNFPSTLIEAVTSDDFFEKALKQNPKNPIIYNDIGIIHLKSAQWENAEKSFRTAISLDPTYQEAFYNLGRLFIHNERYVEAIDNFISATMIAPENEIAQKAIIEYQQNGVIKRIGDKYKNILIIIEKGVDKIVMLLPVLKAIKELHPAIHITVLGNDSALEIIKQCQIIDQTITQPDNQYYDIAILTKDSLKFLPNNKKWLNKYCKQYFLSLPIKDQADPVSYFHIARCFGYPQKKINNISDRNNIQTFAKHKIKLPNIDRKSNKVFCISIQRTGTTSVGKFLRDFGYRWAGWPTNNKNNWSMCWYDGDYEKIFSSKDFIEANAFEDGPWFLPGFYKVLFHRFPNSKFILFNRDPDLWFASMVTFSGGDILGKSRIHCKVYRRELEYFSLLHSGKFDETLENQISSVKTMKLIGHANQYKEIYNLHNIEVQDFFRRHNSQALHIGKLEDPDKWVKLGNFLGIKVPKDYDSHENKSNTYQIR